MIKFWKEDFKYIIRQNYNEGFSYRFSVRGESMNYLINKYDLDGINVKVHVFSDDYITVTSNKIDVIAIDIAEIDKEDTKELFSLLKETIEQDQREWEEYCCDSDYYMWDTRWEK